MNYKHLLLLLALSLGLKVTYVMLAAIQTGNTDDLTQKYIGVGKKNDAFWYEKIAENGYSVKTSKRDIGYSEGKDFHQSEWAFFPMYPGLIATTMQTFGWGFDASAAIWSFLLSFLAMLAVYWFANVYFKSENKALFTTVLLFLFPFSFYFSMFYTEALFLALMLLCFLCIHQNRFVWLAILLVPLVLVRANGLIVTLPLVLYFLEQRNLLAGYKICWQKLMTKGNLLPLTAFLTAPFSFAAYCFYQFKMTGFYFAFSVAQDGWYREPMLPILAFFRRGDVSTQFNSVFAIIVIVFAFLVRKKLPLSLNVLVVISILLPLCSGSVTSMTRFVSVLFPLFFVLSDLLVHKKGKYLFLAVVIVLHFVSFYGWLVGHPITY